MKCNVCGTPLQGALDTYGDANFELCWPCWSSLMFEAQEDNPDLQEIIARYGDYVYVPDEQEALPLSEIGEWL